MTILTKNYYYQIYDKYCEYCDENCVKKKSKRCGNCSRRICQKCFKKYQLCIECDKEYDEWAKKLQSLNKK
jgi:hypothetical protein